MLTRLRAAVLYAANESFFLTPAMNEPGLRVESKNNRRFIRWSHPQTGHPDMLDSNDFETLTTSGCDFARKVDLRVRVRS